MSILEQAWIVDFISLGTTRGNHQIVMNCIFGYQIVCHWPMWASDIITSLSTSHEGPNVTWASVIMHLYVL